MLGQKLFLVSKGFPVGAPILLVLLVSDNKIAPTETIIVLIKVPVCCCSTVARKIDTVLLLYCILYLVCSK